MKKITPDSIKTRERDKAASIIPTACFKTLIIRDQIKHKLYRKELIIYSSEKGLYAV